MNNFDKILNLVKKTGDKIVVMSEDGMTNFLVMPLSEYEKIVEGKSEVINLTEDELLGKINRDIALWKENQRSEHGLDWQGGPEFFKSEDLYDLEDEEKYEDISPPPDIPDIDVSAESEPEKPSVIDLSFEEEEMSMDDKKKEGGEEGFEEEPVY